MINSTSTRSRKGFTLLEIIVTLSIIALFIGSAATLIAKRPNADLDNFILEFNQLARDSKVLAEKSGQARYLIFSRDTVLQVDRLVEEDRVVSKSLQIPSGLVMHVKKHTADGSNEEWVKISRQSKNTVTWLFSRSGTCELIELKLAIDESDYSSKYHVLTAQPYNDEL